MGQREVRPFNYEENGFTNDIRFGGDDDGLVKGKLYVLYHAIDLQ